MKRILLLGFALPVLLLSGCGYKSHKEVAQEFAPRVEVVGLEYFAQIDTNGDGVVDESELSTAGSSEQFSAEDRAVLKHMHEYRGWIGHVTGSKTEEVPVTTLWPIPDGNGGFWYMPVTTYESKTTHFYGINKDDLKSYRSRLEKMK